MAKMRSGLEIVQTYDENGKPICVSCLTSEATIFLNSLNRPTDIGRCQECYERMIINSTRFETLAQQKKIRQKHNRSIGKIRYGEGKVPKYERW